MGRRNKKKTNNQQTEAKQSQDASSQANISELCYQEFEKSLSTMLQTLSSKNLEILKTCAFNSDTDPSTVIGKISAKCVIDGDESEQDLERAILNAANLNGANQAAKIVSVKSTTSSDSTASPDDDKTRQQLQNIAKMIQLSNNEKQQEQQVHQEEPPQDKRNESPVLSQPELKKSHSETKGRSARIRQEREYGFSHSSDSPVGSNRYQINSLLDPAEDYMDIKSNLFLKQKYCTADELSIDNILQKIYFDGYYYDDIKEYILPSLRKVPSPDNYFELLINTIKTYCISIKEHMLEKIDEVMIKTKRIIKKPGGKIELVHEYGGYKKFNKHQAIYIRIIDRLHELYKTLEIIASEVKKITALYLDNFVDRENRIKFNCLELHQKIFVNSVYNDPLIKDFLFGMTSYFQDQKQYSQKYPGAEQMLIELNHVYKTVALGQNMDQYSELAFDEEEAMKIMNMANFNDDIQDVEEYFQEEQLLEQYNQAMQLKAQQQLRDASSMQFSEHDVDMLLNQQNNMGENATTSGSSKKKKKKKNKNKNNVNKEPNTADTERQIMNTLVINNEQSELASTGMTKVETPPTNRGKENVKSEKKAKGKMGKLDIEIEEFERRLQEDYEEQHEKIKANISSDWVQSLKQRLQKKQFIQQKLISCI